MSPLFTERYGINCRDETPVWMRRHRTGERDEHACRCPGPTWRVQPTATRLHRNTGAGMRVSIEAFGRTVEFSIRKDGDEGERYAHDNIAATVQVADSSPYVGTHEGVCFGFRAVQGKAR